jgi:hypothetical protein
MTKVAKRMWRNTALDCNFETEYLQKQEESTGGASAGHTYAYTRRLECVCVPWCAPVGEWETPTYPLLTKTSLGQSAILMMKSSEIELCIQ